MEIELKNIHYSPTLSEDSNAFTANLYVNRKKVCEVSDDGNGGEISFTQEDPKYSQLLKEAEEWCKTLPDWIEPHPSNSEEPYRVKMTLEIYVGQLLEKHLQAKEQQKMERAMIQSLLYGKPGEYYGKIGFKFSMAQILGQPNGHKIMVNTLKKYILPKLTDEVMFMNTNIPEDILKEAGLKEGQYVAPKSVVSSTIKRNQKKGPKH